MIIHWGTVTFGRFLSWGANCFWRWAVLCFQLRVQVKMSHSDTNLTNLTISRHGKSINKTHSNRCIRHSNNVRCHKKALDDYWQRQNRWIKISEQCVSNGPFESVKVSLKWCGYESIYFPTNLLQAKASFYINLER